MTTQNDYPPLISTDEYPLHPEGIYDEDSLWACDYPERPRDGRTVYDSRCASCVLAAEAGIANQGDDTMWWIRTGGAEPKQRTLSWMVARSRWWFVETPEGRTERESQ